MTNYRDDYEEQPWRQQSRRRSSGQYESGSGYSHFDDDEDARLRPAANRQRRRTRDSFGADGRIESVYRPASGRSQYSRNSNRYTSAGAQRRQPRQAPGSLPRDRQGQVREDSQRGYRDQRVQRGANATRYSRDRYLSHEGQGRVRPVSQQSYDALRREKPVNPRLLMILGVIAAVLLAIIVVRFMAFGSTSSEYGKLRDSITQEQVELKELEASNTELQTQMDSWQETIDKYNRSRR